MSPQHTFFNSTIFTTKNNELAILGNTLDDVREKFINFITVYEQYGLKGENGAFSYLFGKKTKNAISHELLSDFERFQELFNNSAKSAEVCAEELGDVDSRIVNYAKTCKNGELTTKGFTSSLGEMTLGAKAATVVTKALAVAGNMLLIWGISKVFEIAVSSINNYIHRVEKAREKLEETISEIESVESEIAQVNKQIDELLSQDALTITDENDLKRLQLENKELEARLKLLTAQKEAETKDLNEKIEKDYKRDFTGRTQVVWEGTGEYATNVYGQEYEIQKQVEYNRETYFYDCVEQLKAYAALERELTEQEKNDFEEKKQYIIDEGTELANLTEAYVPVTIAEQEMADKWNEMITSAADVANMYPGTAMDIVNHLNDKFAKISYIQNEHTSGMKAVQSLSKNTPARYDKEIQNWINSLNNEEQKIMLSCELDNASLEELKQYLGEQINKFEDIINITDIFSLKGAEDKATALSKLSDQLSSVEDLHISIEIGVYLAVYSYLCVYLMHTFFRKEVVKMI